MNRKIFAILITLLFLLSVLSVSITACCLQIKTTETVAVTEITQAPETTVVETVAETTSQVIETIAETPETFPETTQQSYFENIEDKIRFKVEDKMFPSDWYNKEINAKAKDLSLSEIERSKNIIINALKKYPEDVLITLNKTYVLGYLSFYGVEYGGTNSSDCVYITNKGVKAGFTDLYIKNSFHHEFSHILLRSYSSFLNTELWENINPKNFKYLGTGVEAIKEGKASEVYDSSLNEKGFLYKYAQSNLEEDFGSFAENIFVNDPLFWKAIDKYPKLKEKFNLVVDFYHSINPIFTEEYFREISQNK